MKKGTLLIDSSTIDPAVSREMAVAAEKKGAVFMDAPVSGGIVPNKVLVIKHTSAGVFNSAKSFAWYMCLWIANFCFELHKENERSFIQLYQPWH